jgi:U1 snRNP-specific protein C
MTVLTCTKMLACLQLLYVRLSSRYCPAILHHLKIVLLLGLFPACRRFKFSDARRLLNAANTARGRGSVNSFKHSGSVSTLAYRRSACESSPNNQYAATPMTLDHQWASSSSEPVTQKQHNGKL